MVRTTPEDDYDRKLLSDVEGHGLHLVGIDDEDEGPAYVFSVGIFHTLDHPEICLFGLNSTRTMGQIINGIGNLIKSGQSFDDWEESDDVLDGYSCMFRTVDPKLYREYFGYARWFYEGDDFPMLQCVWPDGDHSFPWDADYNAQSQPIMATKKVWPFNEQKNLGVFTTNRVIEKGYPILLVSHDEEGDWQFLCGTTNDSENARLVCLKEIVEAHPSVAVLVDLPMGWQAKRGGPDKPWQRSESD